MVLVWLPGSVTIGYFLQPLAVVNQSPPFSLVPLPKQWLTCRPRPTPQMSSPPLQPCVTCKGACHSGVHDLLLGRWQALLMQRQPPGGKSWPFVVEGNWNKANDFDELGT